MSIIGFDVQSFVNLDDANSYFYICCDIIFKNKSKICNHRFCCCFFTNNLQGVFYQASSFNGDLSSWNTSRVTSMDVRLCWIMNMFFVCWAEINLMCIHSWTWMIIAPIFLNLCWNTYENESKIHDHVIFFYESFTGNVSWREFLQSWLIVLGRLQGY